jgi:hypothetical protein
MCGFMLWMRTQWADFRKETGERPVWDGAWSEKQIALFQQWLRSRYAMHLERLHPASETPTSRL